MGVDANRTVLMQFLTQEIPKFDNVFFDEGKTLFISGAMQDPKKCMSVTTDDVAYHPDLENKHEEADTRIIFHMMDDDKRHTFHKEPKRIIIKANDTDILVLATHFCSQLTRAAEL